MHRIYKAVLFLLANIVLFFLLLAGAIGIGGYWILAEKDTPKPADAIVILAGELTRSFYAADLYIQGYAPKILFYKFGKSFHSALQKSTI